MTEKQFNQLKVGDIVMNNALTKQVQVLDICRNRGLINTGGAWRKYKGVYLARGPLPEHFTRLEPVTHFNLSIKALKRYSLLEVIIIHTIHRAGPKGFIGNNETLREATQMNNSIATINLLMSHLTRDGIVIRECLAGKASRFTINEELAKEYL